MAAGMLLQPFVRLEIGDFNLSYYEANGEYQYLVHSISVDITSGEAAAPQCKFDIAGTADGFEWYANVGRELLLTEPFTITFGYPNGNEFPTTYAYAGLNLTTGINPSIQVDGTSAIKGTWTDTKVSFTMEEEMPLSELPEFLKEKAGKGAEILKFVWKGTTEEDAAKIMVKLNRVNQTPHTILTDQLTEHGMRMTTQDTAIDGTVVIDYVPPKEGESEADPPKLADGTAVPAERALHIVGPGLCTDLKRQQQLNLGQASTGGGETPKSTKTSETEQTDVAQKGVFSQQSAAQSKNPAGATAPSDKPQSRSETQQPSPNSPEARAKLTQMMTTKLTTSFPMVPRNVGIKPRDILCIPSLEQGGYIEDYEITSVSYQMESTGGVTINIQAERPFTGDENMLDAASIQMVRSIADGLDTPAKWNQFYWIQGGDIDYPLAR